MNDPVSFQSRASTNPFEDDASVMMRGLQAAHDVRRGASSSSALLQPLSPQGWQIDTPACSICSHAFGLCNRRHHCRFCGKCICSTCSGGRVRAESSGKLQRACINCIAVASKSTEFTNSIMVVCQRLRAVHELSEFAAPANLREAITTLEGLSTPIEEQQRLVKNKLQVKDIDRQRLVKELEDSTAELEKARSFLEKLGEQLGVVAGLQRPWKERQSLQDNIEACLAALSMLDESANGQSNPFEVTSLVTQEDTANPFDLASSADNVTPGAWEDNTEACGVCKKKLGKTKLSRRHHCRVCGKCVCSACSPSSVQLDDEKQGPQRVCTPCVSSAFKSIGLKTNGGSF